MATIDQALSQRQQSIERGVRAAFEEFKNYLENRGDYGLVLRMGSEALQPHYSKLNEFLAKNLEDVKTPVYEEISRAFSAINDKLARHIDIRHFYSRFSETHRQNSITREVERLKPEPDRRSPREKFEDALQRHLGEGALGRVKNGVMNALKRGVLKPKEIREALESKRELFEREGSAGNNAYYTLQESVAMKELEGYLNELKTGIKEGDAVLIEETLENIEELLGRPYLGNVVERDGKLTVIIVDALGVAEDENARECLKGALSKAIKRNLDGIDALWEEVLEGNVQAFEEWEERFNTLILLHKEGLVPLEPLERRLSKGIEEVRRELRKEMEGKGEALGDVLDKMVQYNSQLAEAREVSRVLEIAEVEREAFDEVLEKRRRAIDAFTEGDVERANEVLESIDLGLLKALWQDAKMAMARGKVLASKEGRDFDEKGLYSLLTMAGVRMLETGLREAMEDGGGKFYNKAGLFTINETVEAAARAGKPFKKAKSIDVLKNLQSWRKAYVVNATKVLEEAGMLRQWKKEEKEKLRKLLMSFQHIPSG